MKIVKNKTKTMVSASPAETEKLGRRLGSRLAPGDVVALVGGLGTGKTVFTRGIAAGLGINRKEVKSPSFVIVNAYRGRFPLYHLDFYRLERPRELAELGWEEFVFGDGVAVIEWADRVESMLGNTFLRVELVAGGERKRWIKLTAYGRRYRALLEKLDVVAR